MPKPRKTVYVIEAKQFDGQWEPIAVPRTRPFGKKEARARLKELYKEFPYMRIAFRRKRIRIRAYGLIMEDE